MLRNGIALGLVLGCSLASAQPQSARWQQALEADPAFAPLAADLLRERTGLEIVVTTTNPGQVLCFGAQGEPVWITPLGEGRSPTTPAAIGSQDRGGALLALGASDGAIVALDAAAGAERWRTPLPAPAKALLWANLDGSGNATLVVAAGESVVALDASGQTRWIHPTAGAARALAASDIDDTGVVHLFGVAGTQVFSLDTVGQPRWESVLTDELAGALALSDADGDRLAELYTASAGDTPALIALDADTGTERWQVPLDSLPAFRPASIVASDLERDGTGEILVAGTGGIVAFRADGTLLWSLATDTAAPPELILADLDRDGRSDVVAAVPGHALLQLRADGTLQYRSTNPIPAAAAVATDLDGDRGLELLIAGAGRSLHALRTPGFATPVLLPWPMAGANPARDNAAMADPALADPGFVIETLSLLENGGFEAGLDGWQTDPATAMSKSPEAMAGSGALQVAGGVPVRTTPAVLDPAVNTLTALVFGKGEGAKGATVEWHDGDRVLRTDRLRALPANDTGWRRFTANNLLRPASADSVQLVLESTPGSASPVLWDEASLVAGIERIPQVGVFANQVGFETSAHKRFTAMSSTRESDARFVLLDEGNTARYAGQLGEPSRIVDAFGKDWGAYYYQGDFTTFEEPGTYRIQVTLGDLTTTSPPFQIQPGLYLTQLMEPVLRFLQAHRAPEGGWKAPGTETKAETGRITYALAETYDVLSWRFKSSSGAAVPPGSLLQELQYGVTALRQASSDGANAAANAAALARAARLFPEDMTLLESARKALEAVDTAVKDPMTFNALANLLARDFEPVLQQAAESQLPAPPEPCAESLLLYEPMTLSAESLSFTLAMGLAAAADALLLQANNPFGVCTQSQPGKPDFFGTTAAQTAGQGNSRLILEAARLVAQAYRFNPKEEYLQFVQDQFNWILGNNPDGLCLMAGMGAQPLPVFLGCSSDRDCTGGIAAGYVGRGPGDDRPYLALAADADRSAVTNTVSFDNAVAWIQTIGFLNRVRR